MKKDLFKFLWIGMLIFLMSSCYTYTFTMGDGPQTGLKVQKMNHYLIYGLAPVNVTTPQQLAGDAKDYEVTIQHTFVDGLINAITFGIYTPTTTIITK